MAKRLTDEGLQPADLLGGNLPNLSESERARVSELLEETHEVLLAANELAGRGIWLRILGSSTYPVSVRERLGDKAPPVLFGMGNASLLDRQGIGIVGSRDVAQEGAQVAEELAREAVDLGLSVVSGAARGVDFAAIDAAMRAKGSVVGVPADSFQQTLRTRLPREVLGDNHICLISQQHPDTGFSTGAAMARNKLIYALSKLTIVVAANYPKGGTWAGATESLRHKYGPLVVWRGRGEGRGNQHLGELGVRSIDKPTNLSSMLDFSTDPPRPVQASIADL
jgi:predicted Rossmann fold nucleotide-binding protein DprA/Smf involved in DNA uptake